MSIAALVRAMGEAGATPEAIALAVEAVEAEAAKLAAIRQAAREKKRRQRAGQGGDSLGTVPGQGGDCPDQTLSLPPSPPEPPQPPTHTRESSNTRGERAREDAAFANFWAAYPRKVSKADARKAFTKAWRKLPPFEEELVLAGGLERAKAAWTDAQFIPHAATWLNGERWQDEATVIPMKPAHERPHPDTKFERRQANLARAFASPGRAAGQRWEP